MFFGWKSRTPSDNLLDDQSQSPTASDTFWSPSDDTAMALLNATDAWAHLDRRAEGGEFSQSNLVSDSQPGHLNASIQDPNLINPWGVAFSPTSPIWVNNN